MYICLTSIIPGIDELLIKKLRYGVNILENCL